MKSITSNILLKIIRYSTYLVLFTPLIVVPWVVFPFVVPKGVFFWVFAEIIFAAWLMLAVLDKRFRPRENVLLYAVGGFILIMLLASFRGVNLGLSFWSTFERMGGIVTLLHGFLLYLALSSTFHALRDWRKFLTVAVFVGAVVSAIFFVEGNDINFLPKTRSGSTLGNSSFFGAYILFPLFFAILLLSKAKILWRKIFFFASFVVMSLALILSGANAALFAFTAGLFFIFIAWLYFLKLGTWNLKHVSRFKFQVSKTLVALLLILSVLGGSLVLYGTFAQDVRITRYLPEVFSSGTIGARKVVWEGAWKGIQERPVLGWGPENFRASFVKYYNPCMPLSECGGERWFDHAHNIVLDMLMSGGFAGLISYLLIFIAALYLLWKRFSVSRRERNWLIPSAITALFIAYFVQNLFVFDMPASYLMLFFVLAMIGGITSAKTQKNFHETHNMPVRRSLAVPFRSLVRRRGEGGKHETNRYIRTCPKCIREYVSGFRFSVSRKIFSVPLFMLITVLLLLASIFFFGYRSIQSANFAYRAISTPLSIEKRMGFYTASLSATPLGNEQVRHSFTTSMTGWIQRENDFSKDILRIAEKEAENMVIENPESLRSHLILGNFYSAMVGVNVLKYKDQARASQYIEKAKRVLERAVSLSPTNQKAYLSLSQIYIFKKDFNKAEELLQKAIDLEPRYHDSHWNLAEVYMFAGEYDKAAKKFDKLYGAVSSTGSARKNATVARAYYETKQFAKAAKWYEKVIALKPSDPEARWTLATIYKELEEYEKAKEQAKIVKKLDAKYVEMVDKFIDELE